jgi:hypothetical protein
MDHTHRQIAKALQRLSRVFGEKPIPAAPATARQSEFTRLALQLKLADQALAADVEALIRSAIAQDREQRTVWAMRLEAIKAERGDVERRRRELAAAVQGWDWAIVHFDQRDAIGPFAVQHTAEASTVKLAKLRIEKLDFPTGAEIFAAVKAARERLELEARALWPDLKRALLPLQVAPGSSIPWKQLLDAAGGSGPTARKHEPAVVFALLLLRAGALEDGWSLQTRPPALAEQDDAISLPRLDRPGDSTRVHAVRIQEAGAAA